MGKNVILGHLSNTNNTPEIAELTVRDILTASNVEVGSDVFLSMANRHNPSKIITL